MDWPTLVSAAVREWLRSLRENRKLRPNSLTYKKIEFPSLLIVLKEGNLTGKCPFTPPCGLGEGAQLKNDIFFARFPLVTTCPGSPGLWPRSFTYYKKFPDHRKGKDQGMP
jgi:hypothetical protein